MVNMGFTRLRWALPQRTRVLIRRDRTRGKGHRTRAAETGVLLPWARNPVAAGGWRRKGRTLPWSRGGSQTCQDLRPVWPQNWGSDTSAGLNHPAGVTVTAPGPSVSPPPNPPPSHKARQSALCSKPSQGLPSHSG